MKRRSVASGASFIATWCNVASLAFVRHKRVTRRSWTKNLAFAAAGSILVSGCDMNFFRRKPKPTNPQPSLPPFQYKLHRVSPSEALQKCLALRDESRGLVTPIILDSPDKYAVPSAEMQAVGAQIQETLEAAKKISVEQWFEEQRARNPEYYQELEEGAWPQTADRLEPSVHLNADETFITEVPTPNAHDAVAYISFGGWNDCPYDHEHVAILKYWQERYGARLLALSGDTLELTVDRPPTTREDALRLAREQFLYCSGIGGEYLSSLNAHVPGLAAALLGSKYWCFWWD